MDPQADSVYKLQCPWRGGGGKDVVLYCVYFFISYFLISNGPRSKWTMKKKDS